MTTKTAKTTRMSPAPPMPPAKPTMAAVQSKAATGISHTAMPALITPSPQFSKRGHIRSSSLENANSFNSKNTLGLPLPLQPAGHAGTLKCRNEQKRTRNKFGSFSNLDDYVPPPQPQGRNKFQNIRQMFEFSKHKDPTAVAAAGTKQQQTEEAQMLQSLPTTVNVATVESPTHMAASYQQQTQPQQRVPHLQQLHLHAAYQQQYAAQQQHSPLKAKSNVLATSGNRSSLAEYNERFSLSDNLDVSNSISAQQLQQQQQMRLQLQRQHSQPQSLQQQQKQSHQQQQQHFTLQQQTQNQRSASGLAHLPHVADHADQQYENLLRPIAFKPIPFEPDYNIPTRCCEVAVVDRYGSTPSLAPAQGSNLRFGSTTDLRHGSGCGNGGSGGVNGIGIGVGTIMTGSCSGIARSGGGGGSTAAIIAGYSSSNYCNSLMACRRGSRSLKINDSMESIRRTPDSDAQSQSSTIKSNCSNNNANGHNSVGGSGSNNGHSNHNNHSSKYMLSEQCDMTPSPSDSGVSDLETALKDRDSELSYLRQTMEHSEKDKDTFWENENKRLKNFYEAQQREYLLKMKKLEQMLAMQQFQFKQHKLRHAEQSNKLREQLSDMKNENEILRSNNSSLKNSERNLKDRAAYVEEQCREAQSAVEKLKVQLEESEWKICERNGEIALLKTQLKEANVEITMKEHALVHLKHENTNAESQIYQSLQEHQHNKLQQEQQQQQQQRQVEEQNAQNQREFETELKQLNKIIILKDQVILALTNELAKLRKELSDLAIFHEYGEEPSGKFMRLKQQLDNLTSICNRTRQHVQKSVSEATTAQESKEKVLDESNLEIIMNCLKLVPPLDHDADEEHKLQDSKLSAEKRLAKMSADIQKFVYGSQNLPDVAVYAQSGKHAHKLEESTLDTLIEESASYAQEIAHLRKQLDDVQINFELEKRQWSEEREKVLSYQKQLQAHYINMYQKLRNLESSSELV